MSTWLYRIVVNSCLMKIRRDKAASKYLIDTGLDDVTVETGVQALRSRRPTTSFRRIFTKVLAVYPRNYGLP